LGRGWKLLIIGQRPRGEALDQAIAEHDAESFVHFTGFAPPAQYADLLAAADMFLFLSLYEGFGLPVLEAMASGTPVIAANASSLPEVVGPAGVLVDATDIEAIAEAVIRLGSDEKRRIQLSKEGLVRASQFNLDRLGEGTVNCYRRAIEGNAT
jgi:alpha-1,3-rhamnosyl/mannosyltransferase